MQTPIFDFITEYKNKNFLRCHVPGHKGKPEQALSDITEIYGADSLYEAAGIIRSSEKNAAALFGADDTFYSCGGSTLAIQGMLTAIKYITKKKTIIAGRYSHKSLISAAALLDFDIVWVYPDEFLSCEINPKDIECILSENNDIAAVFTSSIDYLGGMCRIKDLSEITVKHGLPLLVDNAHGAYLVFTDLHPIKNGASMTSDSAHKTLPALTGTSYLHVKAPFDRRLCKSAISLFGSSSPSYLMLESLDLCNKYIAENRRSAENAINNISRLKSELENVGYKLKPSDYMRISINTAEYGYDGFRFANELRKRKIECEFYDNNYVVLMFSTVCTETDCDRVFAELKKIKRKSPLKSRFIPTNIKPQKALKLREALFEISKETDLNSAAGSVLCEIIAPCPPGVPVVAPGEIIDCDAINLLKLYGVQKVKVI